MNEYTTFADRLKQARESKGLSQKDLAKAIGTTPQAVANYESPSGKRGRPTIESVAAFANVLSCSTDWLLGVDNRPFTLADAAKAAEGLTGVGGVRLIEYNENGELCPALVFTDKCKLTQFMRELQSAQVIKSLEHGEEIYTAWRQKKMDDFAEAEGK